jgi:hypothetical protein
MNARFQGMLSQTGLLFFMLLVAGLVVTYAWADNPCETCACSGNANCTGCQVSYQNSDCSGGFEFYVIVPNNNPVYNYCGAPGGGAGCTSVCLICYNVAMGSNFYVKDDCSGNAGVLLFATNVTRVGCDVGSGGG